MTLSSSVCALDYGEGLLLTGRLLAPEAWAPALTLAEARLGLTATEGQRTSVRVIVAPRLHDVLPAHLEATWVQNGLVVIPREDDEAATRHGLGHWLAWVGSQVPGHTAESEALARRAEGRLLWWLAYLFHHGGSAAPEDRA